METMLQIVRQENIEQRFSRKLIDNKIRAEIAANPDMVQRMAAGVELVSNWCEATYYASKQMRVDQVKPLDHAQLVEDIFVGVCYYQNPTLFTSAAAQLAGRLGFDDKRAAMTTIAELLAVLCATDAFDIDKPSKMASLTVQSRIPLSDELIEFVNQSMYLPPMVCEPLELKSNYASGYLSHKDSLILGSGNHHNGDICLDVLNTLNKVALKLDMQFLCNAPENPKEEFTLERVLESHDKSGRYITEGEAKEILAKQIEGWEAFKKQSQKIYLMLHQNGNRMFLTNKVDKRGRIYAQGFHVNTQGASFKKAAVELANEELIQGAPT
jgi:hypothetical protein